MKRKRDTTSEFIVIITPTQAAFASYCHERGIDAQRAHRVSRREHLDLLRGGAKMMLIKGPMWNDVPASVIETAEGIVQRSQQR